MVKGENMNVKMLKIKDKLNYESVGIFAGQNKKRGGDIRLIFY